ncbi:hypothetical protein R3P38DRAFT_3497255 [Favolaschia claudopus]|uniref:Uncharacterized protein n=1 Tax=Favolaschia claudopus TaxID=2862362 RepID=A0AAV9Z4C0_9AGAR
MRRIVTGERDLPLWVPQPGSSHETFLRNLKIPRDNTGKPDMLLHDLGHLDLISLILPNSPGFNQSLGPESDPSFQTRLNENQRIARQHFRCLLLARLAIFKMFLRLMPPISEMQGNDEVVYRHRWLNFQLMPSLLDDDSGDIFKRLTEILSQEFAAHTEPGPNGVVHLTHPIEDHLGAIAKECGPMDPVTAKRADYIYLVLDEVQCAAQALTDAFREDIQPITEPVKDTSPTAREPRPVLREMLLTWLREGVVIIAAGTGVNRTVVETTLRSVANKYSQNYTTTATGSFIDSQNAKSQQEQYIRRFIPPTLSSKDEECFEVLITRIIRWLRGRFRFTTGFISELLAAGYEYPHETLDEYIFLLTSPPSRDGGVVTTGSRPTGLTVTDAPSYATNDPEIRAKIRNNLSRRVTFDFDKLKAYDEMLDAVSCIAVDFWLTPDTNYMITEHEREFVQWGFARYIPTASDPNMPNARIDEPLVLLALVHWMSQPGFYQSLHFRLKNNIRGHEPGRNGLERYLAFCLSGIFADTSTVNGSPRRLDEIFTFTDNSGRKRVPAWAKQTATLISLYKPDQDAPLKESCVMFWSRPSHHLATSTSVASTLQWLKHQDPAPMCLPALTMGPDLLFVLRLNGSGKKIWVAIQCKYQGESGTDLLTGETLESALKTVKPTNFFASQIRKQKTALDELLKLPDRISKQAGKYSLLRVVASFPANTGLIVGSTAARKGGRQLSTLQKMVDFADKEKHPLASLNMQALAEATANMTPRFFLREHLQGKSTASASNQPGPSAATDSRSAQTTAERTQTKGKARAVPPPPSTNNSSSHCTSRKRRHSQSLDSDVDPSEREENNANGSPSKRKRRNTARGEVRPAASGSRTGSASRKRPHPQDDTDGSGSEHGAANRKPNKMPRTGHNAALAQTDDATSQTPQASSSTQGHRRSTRLQTKAK